MNAPQSIGIIGCGLIADTHVEALQSALPEAVISVCDPLPGKAELLRAKYGLHAAYTTIAELLSNEHPIAVHVLSPPQLHCSHVRECLSAGCHVLAEKPLTLSVSQAQELFDFAHLQDRILAVDHSLLYQPNVIRLLEALKAQPGLHVVQINSFFGLDGEEGGRAGNLQSWKNALPGGSLTDTIVHPISLAVKLTGRPGNIHLNKVLQDDGIHEIHVSWETSDAVVGITVSSRGKPFRRATEIITRGGTFLVDHSTVTLLTLPESALPKSVAKLTRNLSQSRQLTSETLSTAWKFARGRIKQNPGVRSLVQAFYSHLFSGTNLLVSETDVLDTTRVLERITQDLAAIKLPDLPIGTPAISPTGNPTVRTIVTGASGRLGRILCDLLVSDGRRKVVALVRRGPNAEKLPSSPFLEKRFVDLNRFTPADFQSLLKGADEVIHCAVASSTRLWSEIRRQNVEVSLALYDAATAAGCSKYIHLSSVAVYGVHSRKPNLISEATPFSKNESFWNHYIRSKAEADSALMKKAASSPLALLILRPGILYTAEPGHSKQDSFNPRKLAFSLGKGNNHLPFTRIDALAKTIQRALDNPKFPSGDFIVTGRMNETSRQFRISRFAASGKNIRLITLPTWPFQPLAAMLEILYRLTRRPKPPRLTRYILNSATRNLFYDSSKAEKCLGWSPDEAIAIPAEDVKTSAGITT